MIVLCFLKSYFKWVTSWVFPFRLDFSTLLHFRDLLWDCRVLAYLNCLVAIWNHLLILLQIFWAFSIYLEAVAILPQLVLLQRSGNVDNLTGQYVFFLGCVYLLISYMLSVKSGVFLASLSLCSFDVPLHQWYSN